MNNGEKQCKFRSETHGSIKSPTKSIKASNHTGYGDESLISRIAIFLALKTDVKSATTCKIDMFKLKKNNHKRPSSSPFEKGR